MKFIIKVLLILIFMQTKCYAIEISAMSACVIEADSCQVIYGKEPEEKMPMASTTKMMTALLAAESNEWENTVTVSKNAQNQEGSRVYLEEGDRVKMSDLVSALMLNSGNDAAVAIAEHLGGNSENFAKLMTKRAKELGAFNTEFKNPNGLDETGHYSTALDLALIGKAVVENETLREIVSTKEDKIENENGIVTYLRNHNKLLWRYEGVEGIKTGYTKKSGRCLVTSCTRDGIRLICVTLNAPDDWKDHTNMLDYAFSVCSEKNLLKKGETVKKIDVEGESVSMVLKEDITAIAVNGVVKDCDVVVHAAKDLKAPINKDEKIGVARVWQNGYLTDEVSLFSDKNVYEKKGRESFFEKIKNFFKKFF